MQSGPKPLGSRFLEHPASVGETYGEHLMAASRFGLRLIVAGAACWIHGLLPFLFERTGSRAVRSLGDEMARRTRLGPAPEGSGMSFSARGTSDA